MSLVNLHHTLCSGKLVAVHPLPTNHDPLSPLLVHHFPAHARPARLQAGLQDGEFKGMDYHEAFQQLKQDKRWRALGDLTVNELSKRRGSSTSPSTEDIVKVLDLWSIRLACLRRLGFYSIMSSESSGLFSTLGQPYALPVPSSSVEPFFNSVYPFHLIQLWAISHLFAGGDRFLVIKQLREVIHGCKSEYWRTKEAKWKEALISTMLILANILLDMQEYGQVSRILEAMLQESRNLETLTYAFLFHLDMGDTEKARKLLDELSEGPSGKDRQVVLQRTLQLAQGQWTNAGQQEAKEHGLDNSLDDFVYQNNLAVSSLYYGRVRQGIEMLEAQSRKSPTEFFNEETCVSNLITLQELQSGDQLANKLSLLREASMQARVSVLTVCVSPE